jgi:alpha-beta hydrolase superfamily lysophospholipase
LLGSVAANKLAGKNHYMKRILTILLGVLLLSTQRVSATPVCLKDSAIGKQLNLPVYEWVDPSKRSKGVVIAVHGLTLYAYSWDKLATHLAQRGYRVFALDLRGFGRWQTEGAKFNGDNKIEIGQCQQDLLDLVTTLRQANPTEKLIFLGESVGANICLLLASEHPELADAAILGSPCQKQRIHPKLRMTVDFARELIEPNKPLNLTPYAAPYLTNDPALAKACNQDVNINRKMTPVELVKVDRLNNKAFAAAKKLPANYPLLVVAGSEDAMFNQTDLAKAVKKFGTTNLVLKIFPGKAHLLLEHQMPDPQIVSSVDTWLKHQTAVGTLASSPTQTIKSTSKAK